MSFYKNIFLLSIIPLLLVCFAKNIVIAGVELSIHKKIYEIFSKTNNIVENNEEQNDFINNFFKEISPIIENNYNKILSRISKILL